MAQKPNSSDRRRFKRPPRGPAQARLNARNDASDALWLFGLHAVRDALKNSRRVKKRLLVTPNAVQRLAEEIAAAGVKPEIQDPRKFGAPLDPQSVHQGAALESEPLDWGKIGDLCAPVDPRDAPRVVLLDRVTDPHNVGAILRSAEVFGARAVIATNRHSSPETGALAKAASGALERQPYIRVGNLARAMEELQELGYVLIGLDGEAPIEIDQAAAAAGGAPLGIVLGAEGPGLRSKTRDTCDALARIPSAADFASLNVSNATAVALYATRAPAKD
ncbi:MAG: 23S rRNA (guanosine(2251)-2'-O)-methyltransferase RlmB [Pseudomonadota bacterium]